jgi:hypothetical protein
LILREVKEHTDISKIDESYTLHKKDISSLLNTIDFSTVSKGGRIS